MTIIVITNILWVILKNYAYQEPINGKHLKKLKLSEIFSRVILERKVIRNIDVRTYC